MLFFKKFSSIFSPNKFLLIVSFLFSSSLGWSNESSDFSFEIPKRLKPAPVSNEQYTPLARALDAQPLQRKEALKPKIPISHVPGTYSNEFFYIKKNDFNKKINDHVFAVANFTFGMYLEDGRNMGNWESLPLYILNKNKGKTAYHRDPSDYNNPKSIHFCGQNINDFDYDVIAHEVGHSILDYLNPDLNRHSLRSNPKIRFQLQALHEAFGDITSIFSSFYLAPIISDMQSINNLFAVRLKVHALAPCYERNELGLRNPALPHNYRTYLAAGNFHDFSQLITGSIQNIIFNLCRDKVNQDSSGFSHIDTDFIKKLRIAFVNSFLPNNLKIDGDVLINFVNLLEHNLEQVGVTPGSFQNDTDLLKNKIQKFFR